MATHSYQPKVSGHGRWDEWEEAGMGQSVWEDNIPLFLALNGAMQKGKIGKTYTFSTCGQ